MNQNPAAEFEPDENDIELLVDTLRQCLGADKARYCINDDSLIIEIAGLNTLSEDEISEITEPIIEELDTEFDEILLIDLK